MIVRMLTPVPEGRATLTESISMKLGCERNSRVPGCVLTAVLLASVFCCGHHILLGEPKELAILNIYIVNADGQPLEGPKVELIRSGEPPIQGIGSYQTVAIRRGTYELVVSLSGFRTLHDKLNVNGSENWVTLRLQSVRVSTEKEEGLIGQINPPPKNLRGLGSLLCTRRHRWKPRLMMMLLFLCLEFRTGTTLSP